MRHGGARGWIHLCSAALFILTSAALVPVAWIAGSPMAGLATLVYSATIIAMFSVSATYHRTRWRSPTAERWMKRADHSLIFVFIAGSYTPFALLLAAAVLYNIGAVLYGLCWPNPWPQTFGYHEFFHAFTAMAAICHFIAICLVVA